MCVAIGQINLKSVRFGTLFKLIYYNKKRSD